MAMSDVSNLLEQAHQQDHSLKQRAILNEKELELLELREQHIQLVVRIGGEKGGGYLSSWW